MKIDFYSIPWKGLKTSKYYIDAYMANNTGFSFSEQEDTESRRKKESEKRKFCEFALKMQGLTSLCVA